ncbi:arginine--tRNA ligase, partial [Candidatus Parcubacteria bacterium]|nr:arginine--tRNA ligase [Candidatus Parcubacteria bacterium]
MIRQKIKNAIQKAISLSSLPKESSFLVERPTNFVHGDYYSNVAFVLSKRVSFSPNEIAQILKENLEKERQKIFEKIEVSNGFLNFFLSKDFLLSLLLSLLRKREKFFSILGKKRPKVQVEFISANPTGPLHIGNGRGAFFGDCLANLLETAGYKVEREYFINDGKSNSQIEALGKTALKKGTLYLTPYLKEKLKKLEKKLKKIKEEREAGFFLAQEIQKDIKTFIEKKLKIKFDNWVSEQKLYDQGKVEKVYQFLKKKGLIYEKEGAQWLKISQFGAPKDEVVIRQNGQPTYFLSDIAYHKDKFDRKFKKIINIWGADHQGHVPKIKAITKIFNFKGELVIL